MFKLVLTNSGFALASILVVAAFLTATSYTQLVIAALLYPLLIFFAYKVLPLRLKKPIRKLPKPEAETEISQAAVVEKPIVQNPANSEVTDISKRAFLKLIGATGVTFFLVSIFGRKIESLIFGQSLVSSPLQSAIPQVRETAPSSPTDSYKITEIDDDLIGYYGFVDKDGGWFIMKVDSNTGTFRYTKGDKDFSGNWKNRKTLSYDYFHNIFK